MCSINGSAYYINNNSALILLPSNDIKLGFLTLVLESHDEICIWAKMQILIVYIKRFVFVSDAGLYERVR